MSLDDEGARSIARTAGHDQECQIWIPGGECTCPVGFDGALARLGSALGASLLPPIDPSDVTARHIAEVRSDIEATGMGDVGLEIACGAIELEHGGVLLQQHRAREVVAAAWNARHAIEGAIEPGTLTTEHADAVVEIALARGDRHLLAAVAAAELGDGASRWIVAGAWNRRGDWP